MTQTDTASQHEAITAEDVNPELEALRAENQQLRTNLDQRTEQHQALLREMGEKAKQAGIENDWCGVARELVEELGGIWPPDYTTYRVTVRRVWEIEVGSDDESHDAETLADSLTDDGGTPRITGPEWSPTALLSDSGMTIESYWLV